MTDNQHDISSINTSTPTVSSKQEDEPYYGESLEEEMEEQSVDEVGSLQADKTFISLSNRGLGSLDFSSYLGAQKSSLKSSRGKFESQNKQPPFPNPLTHPEIASLARVLTIDVSHNGLTAIVGMRNLFVNLQVIDLSYNGLTIPTTSSDQSSSSGSSTGNNVSNAHREHTNWILNLPPSLLQLNLSHNNISADIIEEDTGGLGWVASTFLQHLPRLERLDLSKNFLTSVKLTTRDAVSTRSKDNDSSIDTTLHTSFYMLKSLSLAHNEQITHVGYSLIGGGLRNLVELDLEGNAIARIEEKSKINRNSTNVSKVSNVNDSQSQPLTPLEQSSLLLASIPSCFDAYTVAKCCPKLSSLYFDGNPVVDIMGDEQFSSTSMGINNHGAQHLPLYVRLLQEAIPSLDIVDQFDRNAVVVPTAAGNIEVGRSLADRDYPSDDGDQAAQATKLLLQQAMLNNYDQEGSIDAEEEEETDALNGEEEDEEVEEAEEASDEADESDENFERESSDPENYSEPAEAPAPPLLHSLDMNPNDRAIRERIKFLESQLLHKQSSVNELSHQFVENERLISEGRHYNSQTLRAILEVKKNIGGLQQSISETNLLMKKRRREAAHVDVAARRLKEKGILIEQQRVEEAIQFAERRKRGLQSSIALTASTFKAAPKVKQTKLLKASPLALKKSESPKQHIEQKSPSPARDKLTPNSKKNSSSPMATGAAAFVPLSQLATPKSNTASPARLRAEQTGQQMSAERVGERPENSIRAISPPRIQAKTHSPARPADSNSNSKHLTLSEALLQKRQQLADERRLYEEAQLDKLLPRDSKSRLGGSARSKYVYDEFGHPTLRDTEATRNSQRKQTMEPQDSSYNTSQIDEHFHRGIPARQKSPISRKELLMKHGAYLQYELSAENDRRTATKPKIDGINPFDRKSSLTDSNISLIDPVANSSLAGSEMLANKYRVELETLLSGELRKRHEAAIVLREGTQPPTSRSESANRRQADDTGENNSVSIAADLEVEVFEAAPREPEKIRFHYAANESAVDQPNVGPRSTYSSNRASQLIIHRPVVGKAAPMTILMKPTESMKRSQNLIKESRNIMRELKDAIIPPAAQVTVVHLAPTETLIVDPSSSITNSSPSKAKAGPTDKAILAAIAHAETLFGLK